MLLYLVAVSLPAIVDSRLQSANIGSSYSPSAGGSPPSADGNDNPAAATSIPEGTKLAPQWPLRPVDTGTVAESGRSTGVTPTKKACVAPPPATISDSTQSTHSMVQTQAYTQYQGVSRPSSGSPSTPSGATCGITATMGAPAFDGDHRQQVRRRLRHTWQTCVLPPPISPEMTADLPTRDNVEVASRHCSAGRRSHPTTWLSARARFQCALGTHMP